MGKEVDRGWSVESHPKAMGLTSWPVRCQPTSMVERHGSWRLCHDMSWPLPGAVEGVTSPNAAEDPEQVHLLFWQYQRHCVIRLHIERALAL